MTSYSNTPPHCDSMLATIEAMRRQEETGYRTCDYLHQQNPQSPTANDPLTSSPVDADCRFRMSEWCYQIVDYCKFKRETVAIAMSCLDRFLCSPAGREVILDRNKFQLVSMTALYTTIKIHEPEAMEPSLVASLSRGTFTREQVEATEVAMLNAIQWRVNPPTAIAFIYQFLDLIPDHLVNQEIRDTIVELAKFQTEVAISDCDFIGMNASTVALAALVNAFDSLNMDRSLQSHILTALSESTEIESQSLIFSDVRIRLYEAITGQSERQHCSTLAPESPCSAEYTKASSSSVHGSPRSVSQPTEAR